MPRTHVVQQAEPTAVSEPAIESSNVAPQAAPAPEAPLDIEAAWNGLDERVRLGIAERLYGSYNANLEEQYGDIIPLVRESTNNPALRGALKEFASDAELRNFIADGGTLEQIRGLQKDPAYREFLFKDATEAYNKYPQTQTVEADPLAPLTTRLQALETQITERDQHEAFSGYVSSRQKEIEALRSSAAPLRENEGMLRHVVEQAENYFRIAAANSGINTGQDDKVWAAQAIRAGIRPPSYIDVYRRFEELSGKTPPPAAPSGSTPARAGRGVQAPRTRVEGAQLSQEERRARTIEAMKKRSLQAVTK